MGGAPRPYSFFAAAGTAAVLAVLVLGSSLHASQDASAAPPERMALADSVPARNDAPVRLSFVAPKNPAQIAREALPAVVEVVTYRRSGQKLGGGSGFLVAPQGLVVTSHHVLEGAVRAEVVLHTGEVYDVVSVAGADARRDLAILRIAGYGLPVVRLGDARRLQAGDPVVVIGSPLGLTNTVTHGLISASREFEGRRLLQISAPISSGSSGGPVFDETGRVVGVLAGFLRKGQNVNFAVPIEYARGLLELPPHSFTVESLGRKRVSLLDGRTRARELSLQAVLRGEPIPGEEGTPWALQPRRVDAERVKASPVIGPAELEGSWELRELSRVPGNRSGLFRGVLVSDATGLQGEFFGSLIQDPEFDHRFEPDRVRSFEARLEPGGRATLSSEHGCTYYVHAAADALAGVYECVDERGSVYDVGAVEGRRVEGVGPSGAYRVSEETALGTRTTVLTGRALIYALPDGRWLGRLVTQERGGQRHFEFRDGRWTPDAYLSARLAGAERARVRGRFEKDRIDLSYPVGGGDYPAEARLYGTREPASGGLAVPGKEPDPTPSENAAPETEAPVESGTADQA